MTYMNLNALRNLHVGSDSGLVPGLSLADETEYVSAISHCHLVKF